MRIPRKSKAVNLEAVEADIIQRAKLNRWTFARLIRALREAHRAFDAYPFPPEPTEEEPSTAEKIAVLAARCGKFALHHPADRKSSTSLGTGKSFTQNSNGRATEFEERLIQGEGNWIEVDGEEGKAAAVQAENLKVADFSPASWREREFVWQELQRRRHGKNNSTAARSDSD